MFTKIILGNYRLEIVTSNSQWEFRVSKFLCHGRHSWQSKILKMSFLLLLSFCAKFRDVPEHELCHYLDMLILVGIVYSSCEVERGKKIVVHATMILIIIQEIDKYICLILHYVPCCLFHCTTTQQKSQTLPCVVHQ